MPLLFCSLDETVRIEELTGTSGADADLFDCRSLCSASGLMPAMSLESHAHSQLQQQRGRDSEREKEARIAELEQQALARQQEQSELRQVVSILTVCECANHSRHRRVTRTRVIFAIAILHIVSPAFRPKRRLCGKKTKRSTGVCLAHVSALALRAATCSPKWPSTDCTILRLYSASKLASRYRKRTATRASSRVAAASRPRHRRAHCRLLQPTSDEPLVMSRPARRREQLCEWWSRSSLKWRASARRN